MSPAAAARKEINQSGVARIDELVDLTAMSFLTRLQRGVWLTHSFYRCLVPNPEVKNQQLMLSQQTIANTLLNLRSHTLGDFEKAMSNLDKAITNSMYARAPSPPPPLLPFPPPRFGFLSD